MKRAEKPVSIKQQFQTNSENVWDAITRPGKMKQWYFEQIENFIAEPGFETRFDVPVNETVFTHCWKVMEVKKNEKISYEWSYSGFSGKGMVSFIIAGKNGKTELSLLFTTLEDFPDEIPEFSRESCKSGWEYLIQKRLKHFLKSV